MKENPAVETWLMEQNEDKLCLFLWGSGWIIFSDDT